MKCGLREILFTALMVGLLVASYFFVFRPAAEKRVQRQAQIEKKRKELADLKLLTAGVGDMERKIEELQSAIKFFESKLPQQKQMDKVLKEIWQMAEANTLKVKTIKSLKGEQFAGYSEQSFALTVSGDFRHGFHAFLKRLETLDRIIRITQMKLDRDSERDGDITAHLTLSIFFEPDADTARVAGAH